MNKQCCYLIMAGGTGGHIFPAMAVAKHLIENGSKVHWLGTEAGMEKDIVLSAAIDFHQITIEGFRGKHFFQRLMAPIRLLLGVFQSIKILTNLNPDVVVGFGGYVAAPGGIAARLLGKKLVIHEQNSIAGSTNKLLSKIATKNLVAFPESLPNSTVVGNPLRKEISGLFNTQYAINADQKINLLVTGGSLGASAINDLIPAAISLISPDIRPNIWHQTGKNKLEKVLDDYRALNIEARCEEFIKEVGEAYQWANIIICRAGALTVSEVAVVGVPAIFIPYPYAIDNHQKANALWLVNSSSVLMMEESQLNKEKLAEALSLLLKNHSRLKHISQALKAVAKPEATERVAAVCREVCHGK